MGVLGVFLGGGCFWGGLRVFMCVTVLQGYYLKRLFLGGHLWGVRCGGYLVGVWGGSIWGVFWGGELGDLGEVIC